MVKVSVDFNFLTSKQKKVYTAIESFIKENGMPPTVREIGELIGEKTPGAVQGILNRLEEKGVIRKKTTKSGKIYSACTGKLKLCRPRISSAN